MTSRRPWPAALVASTSGATANAATAASRQSWFRIDLGRESPAERLDGSDRAEPPPRPRSAATFPAGSDEAGGISRASAGISKVGARVAYLSSKPNSMSRRSRLVPAVPARSWTTPRRSPSCSGSVMCLDVWRSTPDAPPFRRTACNPAASVPSRPPRRTACKTPRLASCSHVEESRVPKQEQVPSGRRQPQGSLPSTGITRTGPR